MNANDSTLSFAYEKQSKQSKPSRDEIVIHQVASLDSNNVSIEDYRSKTPTQKRRPDSSTPMNKKQ